MWGKQKAQIVEVQDSKPFEPDSETRASIVSLQGHLGFQYLMRKLDFQRAVLESALRDNAHSELSEVIRLQSGIFWCRWLRTQVLRETASQNRVSRPFSDEEQELFLRAQAAVELVGSQS